MICTPDDPHVKTRIIKRFEIQLKMRKSHVDQEVWVGDGGLYRESSLDDSRDTLLGLKIITIMIIT